MKEIKLSERDYAEIKSKAHDNWVNLYNGENAVVKSVIDSFLGFCKCNNYIIQNGKVLEQNEEIQERNNSVRR